MEEDQHDLSRFYPNWWKEGSCFQIGWNYFFGTEEQSSNLRNARLICGTCPVVKTCLKHALQMPEEYGIWAGTSARSRESMRAYICNGADIDTIIDVVVDSEFRWRTNERRRFDLVECPDTGRSSVQRLSVTNERGELGRDFYQVGLQVTLSSAAGS